MYKILKSLFIILVFLNLIVIFHAYGFTHFSNDETRSKGPEEITFLQKIKVLALGVSNPKPVNDQVPFFPYETIHYKDGDHIIESWYSKVNESKGTVIIFHGFVGSKSTMIESASEFLLNGYSVLLVDFYGSGGSSGNSTSIGFYESEQVLSSIRFIESKGERNIYLYGFSMGSAAILKAVSENDLKINAIVCEAPFSDMLSAVRKRFELMNLPSFPLSEILTFWGGTINGFNAFNHQPKLYAQNISTPTMVIRGKVDNRISLKEARMVHDNLDGEKVLLEISGLGHSPIMQSFNKEGQKKILEFFLNHSKN